MMTPPRFWMLLAAITALTFVTLFLWQTFLPQSDGLSWFTFWCVVIFVFINVLAYYAGRRAAWSKSRYRFVHFTMLLMMAKMVICVALIVAHMQINTPTSRHFVLPFFTIYLTFTVAELFVLDKLARTTSPE